MNRQEILDSCRLSCTPQTLAIRAGVRQSTARMAMDTQAAHGLLERIGGMGPHGCDIYRTTDEGLRVLDEERAREVCRG